MIPELVFTISGIPTQVWKSFANNAQLSHIPTGPAVIHRTLLTQGVGQIK